MSHSKTKSIPLDNLRILIDGQSLQTDSRERGIGRYAEGVIAGLCKQDIDVIILLNGSYEPRCTEAINRLSKIAPKAKIELFYSVHNFSATNCLGMDYLLSQQNYLDSVIKIKPKYFLSTTSFENQQFVFPPIARISKFVTTGAIFFDFIPLEDYQLYIPEIVQKNIYFSELRELFSADIVFCISKYSESLFLAISPNSHTKVIYGASFSARRKSKSRDSYIFYCGGLDERKNVNFLVNCYSHLGTKYKNKHPLWICCRKDRVESIHLKKYIEESNLSKQVQLVEATSDDELIELYDKAYLFVCPSKSEGLGLPLIEALTLETPILTSNATSLPEVVDNQEAWFSPNNPAELDSKLRLALTDIDFYERLIAYSKNNRNKFTWDKVVLKLLKEFNSINPACKAKNYRLTDLSFIKFPTDLKNAYELSLIRQNRITIYFDVSIYWRTSVRTGIQRVVHKFLQYLPVELNHFNFEVVCIAESDDGKYYQVLDYKDEHWIKRSIINPVKGDWYCSIDLTAEQVIRHETELKTWKSRGVRLIYYVYDIVYIDFPQFVVSKTVVDILTKWLHLVLATADCIISDSKFVSDEVKEYAKLNSINTSNITFIYHHLGSDFNCKRAIHSHCLANNTKQLFQFICVSTIEPRKGFLPLINSFIQALDEGMKARLVIVGRTGWKANDVEMLLKSNPYAGKYIIWENDCSDKKLEQLYTASDCYVYASYYEGFGLGIIEAARLGLPLLLRDIPVFREIAGSHALYFNDESLAFKLMEVAKTPSILPSITGMETLSWEESIHNVAKQLLALARAEYSSILKNPDSKVKLPSLFDAIKDTTTPVEIIVNFRHYSQSTISKLKYKILSRIHPLQSHRQHYLDKLNGVQFPVIPNRPLSKFKRIKYKILCYLAPTKKQRNHYKNKLNFYSNNQ